ncbi:MAG TPA: VWA domain-containing protein [Thermodesulfobacteriota bacterium]|nr:VWA domain-containing protein [Thermodesulfobacteriota bacterium]
MIGYEGCTRLAAWLVVAAIFLLGPAVGDKTQAQSEEASTGGGGVLFILDGSGSMAAQIDGKPKMDVAKEVMINAIKGLPDDVNIGLEVYGHRSKGDCDDIEMLAEVGPTDKAALIEKINSIKPMGKTPITKSFEIAGEKLAATEDETTIVLVSDGEETCEGDPCALVKSLREKGINVRVHVVGFDVGDKEKEQLSCIAEAGGGKYFAADSAAQLEEALAEVEQEVAVKKAPEPAQNILPTGGDKTGSAVALEPGDYVTGHEIEKAAHEYFAVTVKPGQTLSVTFRTADDGNGYAGAAIYDQGGNQLVKDTVIGGKGVQKEISWMAASGEDEYTYYFSAGNEYDTIAEGTSYSIKIDDYFDIESGKDAGATFDDTLGIEPGKHAGYLSGPWGSDEKDYYTIPMTAEQKLGIKLTPETETGFEITIYDQDRVRKVQKGSANAGAIVRLDWTAPEDQEVVYILIEPGAAPGRTSANKYDFDLKVE